METAYLDTDLLGSRWLTRIRAAVAACEVKPDFVQCVCVGYATFYWGVRWLRIDGRNFKDMVSLVRTFAAVPSKAAESESKMSKETKNVKVVKAKAAEVDGVKWKGVAEPGDYTPLKNKTDKNGGSTTGVNIRSFLFHVMQRNRKLRKSDDAIVELVEKEFPKVGTGLKYPVNVYRRGFNLNEQRNLPIPSPLFDRYAQDGAVLPWDKRTTRAGKGTVKTKAAPAVKTGKGKDAKGNPAKKGTVVAKRGGKFRRV